eukprot:TRINITY_DN33325_c0_g1_i2.p1 TRINITY_DN33325_c0_g1~~TRINITY_DN33325_c0_g1_i2.p1  ORF type:complete len:113 (+),score=10.53 TRINITY_DN33325_c0_g1_i2:23-340(+)
MTEFSIAYNRIGDDAMTQLAEGLSGLHDMHELSLIHNHSGDVGLRALVHVLPSLPKLERLSFGPAADCTGVYGLQQKAGLRATVWTWRPRQRKKNKKYEKKKKKK